MQNSIVMERNVLMKMRDGTFLRADIYRPNYRGKYPAILIRTPYSKQLTGGMGYLNPAEAAQAGFAVVIQDIRGRFESDGEWNRSKMFEIESLDGFDSIELLAEMHWCNGKVALAGGSYLAAMVWIGAMTNPPHLKAISPWIGDIAPNMQPFPNSGVINLATAVNAIALTSLDIMDKLEKLGQDVDEIRQILLKVLSNPYEIIHLLPLRKVPFAKYEPIRLMWEARLCQVAMEEQNQRKKFDEVNVPGFHIGGWFDQMEWAIFNNYINLQKNGGSSTARTSQYLLVGPWMHGAPANFLGEKYFGISAGGRGLEIHERLLDFFRKYLLDIDITIPKVRYFVMGLNSWKESETWPLPQTKWVRYYLHSKGKANSSSGDGMLNCHEPGLEKPDTFVYDPLNPVPTHGGKTMAAAGLLPGPFNQASLEQRGDVLCYTSSELENDLEVSGPLRMHLCAATTAVDTDFTAKLVDVNPNGEAYYITDGIQRASHRNWFSQAEPVKAGEIYEYKIDMGNTSIMFNKGHRIRIEISSSNFPWYDRNMNTGNPIGEDSVGVLATQTIFHDKFYASYIDLPIIESI